jgi:hypothetical protein
MNPYFASVPSRDEGHSWAAWMAHAWRLSEKEKEREIDLKLWLADLERENT